MPEIEIGYCVAWGLLDNAIRTQHSLLKEYGHERDTTVLTPGRGGVFEVRVDGDPVFDADERDEGYDLEAVTEAVHDSIGAPA